MIICGTNCFLPVFSSIIYISSVLFSNDLEIEFLNIKTLKTA